MLARVTTFAIDGLDPRQVTVEVDVRAGLPSFTVVGLADAAVREARERVRAAILNSGFEFPRKRLTVNLAPGLTAQGRARASTWRSPAASSRPRGQVPAERARPAGGVRRAVARRRAAAVPGRAGRGGGRARGAGSSGCSSRVDRVGEAALVAGARRRSARRRCGRSPRSCAGRAPATAPADTAPAPSRPGPPDLDLADVRGHGDVLARADDRRSRRPQPAADRPAGRRARRCSPGACRRILPPLTARRGARGHAHPQRGRPARTAPGSSRGARSARRTTPSRASGLVGGGAVPVPGEASLAHHGVLFLDELSEFPRPTLEALRQPLEDGRVVIVRGQRSAIFPTRFMLVAATNPCPCGFAPGRRCRCSEGDLARHRRRLSGPLLDRLDLLVHVQRPEGSELAREGLSSSARERERVLDARERQAARLRGTGAASNGQLDARRLHELVDLAPGADRPLARRLRARPAERPRPRPRPAGRPDGRRPRRERRRSDGCTSPRRWASARTRTGRRRRERRPSDGPADDRGRA